MSALYARLRAKLLWSKLLFAAGWGAFWLAGTAGERVSVAALLVGPGLMASALILLHRSRFRVR